MLAHPSADPDVVRTALIRGAFEFQGQKCSAASRAYVAKSVWNKMKDSVPRRGRGHRDGRRHRLLQLHGRGDRRPGVRQAQGRHRAGQAAGQARRAWSAARPTTRSAGSSGRPSWSPTDPTDAMFTTEYFGPILAVHVYDDGDFEKVARQLEGFAPYALTGAVIARDRRAIAWAQRGAAVRGRQLLRQRQADRRGRRPAAVRRRPGQSAPTTRPAPRSTCCAGPRRARSRRRWSRRPTTATPSWAEG